ncbi:MAG: type II toxin-antitoxin system RelB/DinJ family antitoxin [Gracilibacteraceae bacterium]|jgi:DNA-damage-inducible protein J|nr:type II toxin-antitoxin system RelB/DinJ family antitoxin [Gracilibacteraceae bacterium]
MAEARLSVRIDPNTKRQAEAVFDALGMNLSTGISVYLKRVAATRAIPFALELNDSTVEQRMRNAVNAKISAQIERGVPIALFDNEQNRPYLEYEDGRRVYELD